jgi:hypothetical protein
MHLLFNFHSWSFYSFKLIVLFHLKIRASNYVHYERNGILQLALQLNQNNSFSTTIQLHYNYTHDVMLMSLIVIHALKFNIWHYENL